jgi:tetratricopeptide (TPR) repeat protein
MVEGERRFATILAERGRFMDAAFVWDGVRALARLLYGPGDPRVLAALARTAGSIWESSEIAVDAHVAQQGGDGTNLSLREELAVTLSAAAASGFMKIVEAGGSESCPDCMPEVFREQRFVAATIHAAAASVFARPVQEDEGGGDAGGAPESRVGYGCAVFRYGGENACSEIFPEAGGFTVPEDWHSLGPMLFPAPEPAATSFLREATDVFRLRLAEAEGPAGAGPGSREALNLRSRLGAELCDSDDPASGEEGLGLLREASEGLDALQGPGGSDALDAKLNWARCLAELPGPARIPWEFPLTPPLKRLRAAEALLREAVSAADGLPDPHRLRFRPAARLMLARVLVALKDREGGIAEAEAAIAEGDKDAADERAEAEWGETDARAAIRAFETGEYFRNVGDLRTACGFHGDALEIRRILLGWRHPETAQSLALSGDLDALLEGSGAAMCFWAHALEALEGMGELFERERAMLELRLGQELMDNRFYAPALPILEKALARATGLAEETDWLYLESLRSLAFARFLSGLDSQAEENFEKLARLLDSGAARPRTRADAVRRQDMLFRVLAGLGSILKSRGNLAAAIETWSRALRIRLPDSSNVSGELKDGVRNAAMSTRNNIMALLISRPKGPSGNGGVGRKGGSG